MARRTLSRSCSKSNSGVCAPITTRPCSRYLASHARRYGSVRNQLTHVYVQKSTSTTLPRRPSAVSGGELSHVVAPRSAANPRSAAASPCSRASVAPSMVNSSPARAAAVVARKRRRSWLMCTGRLLDQSRHGGRVRQERHVTRFDLGGLRVYAFGVEPLEVGIDGLVILCHEVPRWDRLPRRLVRRCAEHTANDGLLRRRKDARLHLGQIGGKDRVELRGVDVEETSRVGPERRAEGCRILV